MVGLNDATAVVPNVDISWFSSLLLYFIGQVHNLRKDYLYTISRSSKNSNNVGSMCNMSGQCAWPGLQLNYFYTLAEVTTGWGPIQHIFSWTIKVADNWRNILWFFCVSTCSTTLLGGGILQAVKSCDFCIRIICRTWGVCQSMTHLRYLVSMTTLTSRSHRMRPTRCWLLCCCCSQRSAPAADVHGRR